MHPPILILVAWNGGWNGGAQQPKSSKESEPAWVQCPLARRPSCSTRSGRSRPRTRRCTCAPPRARACARSTSSTSDGSRRATPCTSPRRLEVRPARSRSRRSPSSSPIWPVVWSLMIDRRSPAAVSCMSTASLSPEFMNRSSSGFGVNVVAVEVERAPAGPAGTPFRVMNAKFDGLHRRPRSRQSALLRRCRVRVRRTGCRCSAPRTTCVASQLTPCRPTAPSPADRTAAP